jgi:hypothetical protein
VGEVNESRSETNMKKMMILMIAIVAIVLCVIGILFGLGVFGSQPVDENVLAKVEDITITREQVEERVRFNKVQNAALMNTLKNSLADASEITKIMANKGAEDETGALEELVKAQVICQQAEKEGVLISREETDQVFDDQFALLKKDSHQKSFYENLKAVFLTYDMSEEEYIRLGKEYSYDFYNFNVMKQHFRKEKGIKDDEDQSDEQFKAYVSELVEKADVTYY